MNAPLTCPNSSLSSSGSGIAAQLTATKGPLLRALRLWRALATSSLPVPLSPVTSTVVSVSATRATSSHVAVIAGLLPRISSKRIVSPTACLRRLTSFPEGAVSQRPLDREREIVDVERLRHEIVCARAYGRDGGVGVRIGGGDDDGDVFAATDDLRAKLDPAQARHADVGQHHLELVLVEVGETVGRGRRPRYSQIVAGQLELQQLAHAGVIVDDEDAARHEETGSGS